MVNVVLVEVGKYVSNKKKVRMTDERDQDRDRDQESGKELV